MKIPKFLLAVLGLMLVCTVGKAPAAVSTLTIQPSSKNLGDLDYHVISAWTIGNISITGSPLSFTNIGNWDEDPNGKLSLFASAVSTFQDVDPDEVRVIDFADGFLTSASRLIAANSAKTKFSGVVSGVAPGIFTSALSSEELSVMNKPTLDAAAVCDLIEKAVWEVYSDLHE